MHSPLRVVAMAWIGLANACVAPGETCGGSTYTGTDFSCCSSTTQCRGSDKVKECQPLEYTLAPLPYATTALAPFISNETVTFHYTKHHAGYVNNLNGQVPLYPQLVGSPIKKVMKQPPTTYIFNQAAQIYNHDFYWVSLAPPAPAGVGGVVPTAGPLFDLVTASYSGGFTDLKAAMTTAAATSFGSGWTWLVLKAGKLGVVNTHDASNPIVEKLGRPLLVIDTWEHAYYIDVRNARSTYIASWWNVVDWGHVEKQLQNPF